ncbi:hypothetical protein LINGRAHAP2_LOCUS22656 [Linum grandiflorum]
MADQVANREWKLRYCDCKAPVRQRVNYIGVGRKRVFLECQQWEYGVGCHYCKWLELIHGRKARGGFLQSSSFSNRVADDFSAENARLQVIVSNQAKKLEDIAEAFLAVTARQAFMAERAPKLDLKSRLCDCKVPVHQTIVPLGPRTKRVFLECWRWEYGVGCRYCESFMTGRKVHGGLLLSGSLSDQVVVELTVENARLKTLISSQAKQLEDAAHALSATSVHPPASEGCDPPNENETS